MHPRRRIALTFRGVLSAVCRSNQPVKRFEQSNDRSNKMPSSRGSIARMLVLSVALMCPFAIYGSSDQGYFFGTADAGAHKATDIATASATSTQIQLAQNETDLSSTGNPSTVPLKWSGLLVNTECVIEPRWQRLALPKVTIGRVAPLSVERVATSAARRCTISRLLWERWARRPNNS